MITPKHLHEGNILASRILWLKAQMDSVMSCEGGYSLVDIAQSLECTELVNGVLRRWLRERIANDIDDTRARLRAAGVDPDGEWPER